MKNYQELFIVIIEWWNNGGWFLIGFSCFVILFFTVGFGYMWFILFKPWSEDIEKRIELNKRRKELNKRIKEFNKRRNQK